MTCQRVPFYPPHPNPARVEVASQRARGSCRGGPINWCQATACRQANSSTRTENRSVAERNGGIWPTARPKVGRDIRPGHLHQPHPPRSGPFRCRLRELMAREVRETWRAEGFSASSIGASPRAANHDRDCQFGNSPLQPNSGDKRRPSKAKADLGKKVPRIQGRKFDRRPSRPLEIMQWDLAVEAAPDHRRPCCTGGRP